MEGVMVRLLFLCRVKKVDLRQFAQLRQFAVRQERHHILKDNGGLAHV